MYEHTNLYKGDSRCLTSRDNPTINHVYNSLIFRRLQKDPVESNCGQYLYAYV